MLRSCTYTVTLDSGKAWEQGYADIQILTKFVVQNMDFLETVSCKAFL